MCESKDDFKQKYMMTDVVKSLHLQVDQFWGDVLSVSLSYDKTKCVNSTGSCLYIPTIACMQDVQSSFRGTHERSILRLCN